MKFSEFIQENYAFLTAVYDDKTNSIRIIRANGQTFNVKLTEISNTDKVFGVNVKDQTIQVFVGPKNNPQPVRVIYLSNAGIYQGSKYLV